MADAENVEIWAQILYYFKFLKFVLIYYIAPGVGEANVDNFESLINLLNLFRYDPRTDKWYMVRQMSARRKHLGTAVYNGFLYAVGGRAESCELNSAEKYDPVKNEWIPVNSMMSRRSGV